MSRLHKDDLYNNCHYQRLWGYENDAQFRQIAVSIIFLHAGKACFIVGVLGVSLETIYLLDFQNLFSRLLQFI